jgi:hypothetical protein
MRNRGYSVYARSDKQFDTVLIPSKTAQYSLFASLRPLLETVKGKGGVLANAMPPPRFLVRCGAPERLTAFGAHTVITTLMDQKVQLINPLNLGELYAA